MPPFSSTSFTTIVRRTVAAARQQVIRSRVATRAALLVKRRAFGYARSALHETFPSLSQPTFQRLQPRLAPLPIPVSPLQRAALKVRTSGTRFASTYPRGAAVVSRVGLDSSRNFSTTIAANTPGAAMIVRGIYGIRDEDIKRWGADKWSRAGSPAISRAQKRHRRCSARVSAVSFYRYKNVDLARRQSTESASQIDQFFPLTSQVVQPEHTTEDATATLAISCVPSAGLMTDSLVQSTTLPVDLGRTQFADLLHGLLAVPMAYNTHQSTKVIPLINRLRSAGLLNDRTHTALQIRQDVGEGVIEITFPHRSARNVRVLLGDVLGENEWYFLSEVAALSPADVRAINGISAGTLGETTFGAESPSSGVSDVSSASSHWLSTILDRIPDVPSGFSTPTEQGSEACHPLEIGMSGHELILPRIDLTDSSAVSTLTPPSMSYASAYSAGAEPLAWPDDQTLESSPLSSASASWASLEDIHEDGMSVWSDGATSNHLLSSWRDV